MHNDSIYCPICGGSVTKEYFSHNRRARQPINGFLPLPAKCKMRCMNEKYCGWTGEIIYNNPLI